jgi:hypothetical protein
VSDGDFLPQEANIDLIELQSAVLEDAVITAIRFAESWRISRNHAVAAGMLRLNGLPASPQETCHVDKTASGAKSLPKAPNRGGSKLLRTRGQRYARPPHHSAPQERS